MRILPLLAVLLLLIACEQAREFEEPVPYVPEPQVKEIAEENVEEGNAKEELENFLNMKNDFRADYVVRSVLDEEEITGTQVVAARGKDSKQETEQDSLFVVDDKVYVCDNQEKKCYNVPQEGPVEEADIELPENITVTKVNSRKIAGIPCECFEVITEEDSVTHCFDLNGVTLYFHRQAEGYELEMTATSVISTVPDSEFELPYEAVDLES